MTNTDPAPRRDAQIAVIVPTFNRATTILRAVVSALDATDPGIEVIVVDDASTDRTRELLAGMTSPRLRILTQPVRSNQNAARNRALASSAAPIVAFLDSDDEFLPGRTRRLVRLFAERPDIDAVLDSFHVETGGARQLALQPARIVTGDTLASMLVAHALPMTTSAIAVRRAAIDAIGGFDPDLTRHTDRDLLLRIGARFTVALGTGCDLVKHQRQDSVSRSAVNYIGGLDALVARHPVFLEPRHADLLAYLCSRSILSCCLAGHFGLAVREWRALKAARHLPQGFLASLWCYPRGRRQRRAMESEIRSLPKGAERGD